MAAYFDQSKEPDIKKGDRVTGWNNDNTTDFLQGVYVCPSPEKGRKYVRSCGAVLSVDNIHKIEE